MATHELHINFATEIPRAPLPFLRKHLAAALPLVSSQLRDLSIAIVGDTTMGRLHQQYLQIAGPTDVLTFELEHDKMGRVTSGEVVICHDEAVRQCEPGHALREELLLYAVHGLLHLSGFDDRTPKGYKAMHEAEDKILEKLGVGAVFHRKSDAGLARVKSHLARVK